MPRVTAGEQAPGYMSVARLFKARGNMVMPKFMINYNLQVTIHDQGKPRQEPRGRN